MINKIDKERRHSMNAAPTRTSGKEPRRTPKKNRTGHKAEHGVSSLLNILHMFSVRLKKHSAKYLLLFSTVTFILIVNISIYFFMY
jgi:hypothetical protein